MLILLTLKQLCSTNEVRLKKCLNVLENHSLILDEPKSLGGTDEGMTPLGKSLFSLVNLQNRSLERWLDAKQLLQVISQAKSSPYTEFIAKKMKFDLKSIRFEISGQYDPSAYKDVFNENPIPTQFHTISLQAELEVKLCLFVSNYV